MEIVYELVTVSPVARALHFPRFLSRDDCSADRVFRSPLYIIAP